MLRGAGDFEPPAELRLRERETGERGDGGVRLRLEKKQTDRSEDFEGTG